MSLTRYQFRAVQGDAPAEIVTKSDGKQFLHLPIASLVGDTVLNWYLVPTDSVAQSVANWVGKPVTINHPPEDEEAAVTFFSDAANIAGEIVDSKIVNGKLIHIAELPYPGDTPEKKAILNALLGGTVMEVSTGYYAWPIERDGNVQGKAFRQVHTDIAPDHLALLPTSTGACSVAAGCGTLRANSLQTARTPAFSGVETGAGAFTLADFIGQWNACNDANLTDFASLTPEAKAWIANHTLLGDPNATEAADLLAFPVVNPATGALNRAALVACLADRRSHAALGRERRTNLRAAATELLGNFAVANAATPEPTPAPVANAELDLEERIRVVSRAIWEQWAPREGDDLNEKPWPYVQHVYGDHAIFEQGAATYRVNFELSEVDGLWTAALGERVRGAMEFVAAENGASAGSKLMNFFRRLTGSIATGVKTMQRNELIAKVAAKLEITPERAGQAFASAKDCELEKLLATNEQEPEDPAPPAVPETPAVPVTPAAQPLTRDAIMAAVPEFAQFCQQNQARETNVRNQAKAKAQALGLTEADILAAPLPVLEALLRRPAIGDFGAAAGGDPFGFEHQVHADDVEFRAQDVLYTGPVDKAKVQ